MARRIERLIHLLLRERLGGDAREAGRHAAGENVLLVDAFAGKQVAGKKNAPARGIERQHAERSDEAPGPGAERCGPQRLLKHPVMTPHHVGFSAFVRLAHADSARAEGGEHG